MQAIRENCFILKPAFLSISISFAFFRIFLADFCSPYPRLFPRGYGPSLRFFPTPIIQPGLFQIFEYTCNFFHYLLLFFSLSDIYQSPGLFQHNLAFHAILSLFLGFPPQECRLVDNFFLKPDFSLILHKLVIL